MIAFTIVSRAYVPHARVLARSYARFHPGSQLRALLIDDLHGEIDEQKEPFNVVRLSDIGVPSRELHQMAMLFGGRLIAAIKPWVFRHLLQRGADAVLYLDSDFVVFDSLSSLGEAAHESGVVVVPHVITPMPRDGHMPDETLLLGVGTFNAGMFGVGAGGGAFLEFLMERLRRECYTDMKAMRVNEQRWLDFVPPLFPHYVARDPGLDVAPWNIHERPLSREGEKIFAAGAPLRAFHFSGFDPRVPSVLSARDYSKQPRIQVASEPVLHELVDQYRSSLLDAGFESHYKTSFAFDFLPDGRPIPASLRSLYAEALEAAERTGTSGPPDPFDPEAGDEFQAWIGATYGAAGRRVPHVLQDLQPAEGRTLVAMDGAMTLGDAGRRGTGGVIEAIPGGTGFIGFCPRLLFEAGRYRVFVDARPNEEESQDSEGVEKGSDLVVDLSIDGHVIDCFEVHRDGDASLGVEVTMPTSLEALALSSGVDMRFFTHGGTPWSIDAVVAEKIDDVDHEIPHVNWALEMLMAQGCRRTSSGTIRQESDGNGLVAVGPHWRLWPGRYRAELQVKAEGLPEDPTAIVCHVEALVDSRALAYRQLYPMDLMHRTTSLEFEVSEDHTSVDVEFRVRGESTATLEIGPLFVTDLDPAGVETEALTDWLPGLWLSDAGRRTGAEISGEPGNAGVMTVGPHWRLDPGRYSLLTEVDAGTSHSSSIASAAGDIEVLVNGFVEATQVIETRHPGGLSEEQSRTYRMEFEVPEQEEPADVEIRFTTTGVVGLRIRSLRVLPSASAHEGAV